MFRCPHCAQAQEMPIGFHDPGVSIIRVNEKRENFGPDKLVLAHENDSFEQWNNLPEENLPVMRVALEDKALDIIRTRNAHLSKKNQQEERTKDGKISFMVKCPRCNEEHYLQDWFLAWDDPLRFDTIETEHLCHCGGELEMDRVPNSQPPKYAWVCVKCQWVKPNESVSGAK